MLDSVEAAAAEAEADCAEAAEAGGPAAEGGGPDEFSMGIADGLRGSRLE